jgi:hypothetical protein
MKEAALFLDLFGCAYEENKKIESRQREPAPFQRV